MREKGKGGFSPNLYVYESTNLARLIVCSPYSNKFENPLPI